MSGVTERIGRRLAELMVKRSLGWTKRQLASAFNVSELEVHDLLDRHGDPPKFEPSTVPIWSASLRQSAPRGGGRFMERSQPREE